MSDNPTRIYGDVTQLEYDDLQSFFENIAHNSPKTNNYIHGATMYQADDIALLRNQYESELVQSKIDFNNKRVFEVGCGTGRWAQNLCKLIKSYLGIDFSPELIRSAQTLNIGDHCKFQVMPANNLESDKLIIPPPFDIIICSGICVYLNDADLATLIKQFTSLLAANGIIYLREPISTLDRRMTLKDFYSTELATLYHGIYRTDAEYKTLFAKHENLQLLTEAPLYDKKMHDRQETRHKYYIFTKLKQAN